jgi:nicotinamidase-related amidase
MRILLENTVAICVDIQEKFTDIIYKFDRILSNSQILIRGLNILEVPIIVTEQYPKGLGYTTPEIKEHLNKYNPIEKLAFSCCGSDEFRAVLEKTGKKNVIVFGIETHVCVLQTVIDLLEMNYQPVLIEDCVSSRKKGDRKIALNRMRQEGAIITSYESILFELSKIAGTEKFKQISKLVK